MRSDVAVTVGVGQDDPEPGLPALRLVDVPGTVRGSRVVLVSRRRLWADVVQRCISRRMEAEGDLLPSEEMQPVFIVDAVLDLRPLIRELKALNGKILVCGGFLHSSRVLDLLASGADGYVPELAHRSELVQAIDSMLNGEVVAPFAVPAADPEPRPLLTPAEELAARYYFLDPAPRSRSEVAAALGISDKTLSNQLLAVRRKIGAKRGESRTAVARRMAGSGFQVRV